MNIETVWLIVIAMATPIAGFVGFVIQLRQVKKIRFENEKLQLEIAALKANASKSENQIVRPTNSEVMQIAHPDRVQRSIPDPDADREPRLLERPTVKQNVTEAVVAIGLLLIAAYFIYDIYRLATWIWAKL